MAFDGVVDRDDGQRGGAVAERRCDVLVAQHPHALAGQVGDDPLGGGGRGEAVVFAEHGQGGGSAGERGELVAAPFPDPGVDEVSG